MNHSAKVASFTSEQAAEVLHQISDGESVVRRADAAD